MASKLVLTGIAVIASACCILGCSKADEDAVVIEGPKASDMKEAGMATQGAEGTAEAAPAKPAQASGPRARDGR